MQLFQEVHASQAAEDPDGVGRFGLDATHLRQDRVLFELDVVDPVDLVGHPGDEVGRQDRTERLGEVVDGHGDVERLRHGRVVVEDHLVVLDADRRYEHTGRA